MKKKLLAVFAHPDDESFGPSGTLAKYAMRGVEIHILCATRGEAGQNHLNRQNGLASRRSGLTLGQVREQEAIKASQIIGAKSIEFLGFLDGELKQNNYHQLADKIMKKINSFKPDVVLTFEDRGISGHIDHICVSMTTTYAYLKTRLAKKLYYFCVPNTYRKGKTIDDYFIYFPPGYKKEEITTFIDIKDTWEIKIKSMLTHKSQMKDAQRIIKESKNRPRVDHLILKFPLKDFPTPEDDLFSGI